MKLASKVETSLERIRAYVKQPWDAFVGHSGGKDSCVVLYLATIVHPDIAIIHNPKDNTHIDTIQFLYGLAKSRSINFIPVGEMPDIGWKLEIDGSRRAEAARTDRSSSIIVGGVDVNRNGMPEFVSGGIFGLDILYPIVDWTDKEVWEFLISNKIPISAEYGVDY